MLDTDAISALQYKEGRIAGIIGGLDARDVFVTVVSLEEQVAGRLVALRGRLRAEQLQVGYGQLAATMRFFAAANLLAYDPDAAAIDARLAVTVRRLGTMDRRIAAICLAHGATLVTGNVKDFGQVPGLSILDWRA